MKNFYSYIRNFTLPSKNEINSAFFCFSKKERLVFLGLTFALFFSTLAILQTINKSFMVNVPLHGGEISEGIVGTPRFINPILATSGADQDIVALIYSGLMRKNPDGTLIPDLAEKYEVSKDGLIYTFTLKNGLYFQDGEPLTANDIFFTINKAKDSVLKSPQKVNWDGVTIEQVDEKTIKFTLKQPYSSFLDNTTLGILPAHLWEGTPVELNDMNINPIGSGPYMIDNTNKQSSGLVDSYELIPFKKFVLGESYLKKISLYFYANEDELVKALEKNEVDEISSISPLNAENLKELNYEIQSSKLPRVFGLFFNQSVNQIFTNKTITKAIDQTIDKEKIVREIFFGYGSVIDDPIPLNILQGQSPVINTENREVVLQKVKNDLAKDGWKIGSDGFLEKSVTKNKKKVVTKLEFSISTGNAPELVKTAELIKQDLAEVGIKVDVKTFEIGNLNQNVIRPRKYDALLFGEIINHESDLFAFWHSTQRKDPGLNVAMYTNAKVDKILEDASMTSDKTSRIKKYAQFETEIKKDLPAVFLYSPNFVHVVSKKLERTPMSYVTSPSDRYLNVYSWYTQTENVWKIFTK